MIKFRRALVAGLCASIAVVAMIGAGALAVRFVPALRKSIERADLVSVSIWDRVIVAAVVVVGGVVIALFYALIFEFVTRRAGWLIGALIGAAHGMVSWMGAALAVWFFPRVADTLAGELALLFDSVVVIAGFVAIHVVYGLIVAAVYGRPKHSAAVSTRIKWRAV